MSEQERGLGSRAGSLNFEGSSTHNANADSNDTFGSVQAELDLEFLDLGGHEDNWSGSVPRGRNNDALSSGVASPTPSPERMSLTDDSGLKAITSVGRRILRARRKGGQHIITADVDDVKVLTRLFLERCRRDFPVVEITALGGASAETQRVPWDEDRETYLPKKSFILLLNGTLIADVLKAKRDMTDDGDKHAVRFRQLLFFLGVVVAHELVHAFNGFLCGYVQLDTPSDVDDCMDPDALRRGEAGRVWERLAFGGRIDWWWVQDDECLGVVLFTKPVGNQAVDHWLPETVTTEFLRQLEGES
ncbi:hypothetical protein NKR23_g6065 [Pleurostoma richardsiae]|uniref:Uncharacterized protein n=1 Tax=Pleurostoma richardsiae TaxID=41990 RepID=A0AA38RDK3_9PEZI|nr:hypothetical protein NKR23_g6065 [Pleurostoma richardsiae]